MLASNGHIHRYFPSYNGSKTHCVNGHEFTPENTRIKVVKGRTRRQCKACDREAARDYYLYKRKPKRKEERRMRCPSCGCDVLERGGARLTATETRVWDSIADGVAPSRMTHDTMRVHISRINEKLRPGGWRIVPLHHRSKMYVIMEPKKEQDSV